MLSPKGLRISYGFFVFVDPYTEYMKRLLGSVYELKSSSPLSVGILYSQADISAFNGYVQPIFQRVFHWQKYWNVIFYYKKRDINCKIQILEWTLGNDYNDWLAASSNVLYLSVSRRPHGRWQVKCLTVGLILIHADNQCSVCAGSNFQAMKDCVHAVRVIRKCIIISLYVSIKGSSV